MKQKSIKLNAILNVIKQCIGILFPLITYPYISRVLGADNLGRYSFSDSIVQIAITISMIGIPTYAIREGAMIRNDKKKISDFCSEVFTINLIASILCYCLLFILVTTISRIRIEFVFVMILSVNIMSRCLGRDWINSIYEDFLYISIRYILIHLISLFAIFLFVKSVEDIQKYVIIMACSELIGNLLNIYYTRKIVPIRLCFSRDMIRHLKPILVLFSSSIASTIYIRSDIAILGFLRPDNDVGVYTMSSKIYTIIKSVLNAVIMVAIPRLSSYLGEGKEKTIEKYNNLLNNLSSALILLLLPAAVGLLCLSNDVMYILGDAEFEWGGGSLKILCIAMIFAVFGCFFAYAVLIVNRREKIFFRATVISAIVNIGLNFILIPLWGIEGAAFTTMLSEIAIVLICGIPAKSYFKLEKKKFVVNGITAVVECITIVVVAFVTSNYISGAIMHTVVCVVISIIIYLIILLATKNTMIISFFRKNTK